MDVTVELFDEGAKSVQFDFLVARTGAERVESLVEEPGDLGEGMLLGESINRLVMVQATRLPDS
jgi:hypothetical protein